MSLHRNPRGEAPARDERLIEPVPTPMLYCDGVGPIDVRDGMVHLVLWAEQSRVVGPGTERIVVGRLVMKVDLLQTSTKAIGEAVQKMLAADRAKLI